MKAGRDLWWHEVMSTASAECAPTPLDSEHPLFIFTEALPKTRSGRIMRRLLRDIAAGKETVGHTTTLEDYSVLARLREEEE